MTMITALASFGLLSLAIVGFSIMHTYATRGFAFGFSSNRPATEPHPFELRIKRVLQNHTESAAYIVPALVVGHLAGLTGSGPALAALLIVLGRVAYTLLYLTGISFVRVPAFVFGTLGCLYLFAVALV